MNHANPSLAKTEIIKQLGYFPAFLIPAINSSLIYQSLVQQTLFGYINNPLPSQFKEKLFVVLSRHFGINYFTICHSCTLRSLGVSAKEILALDRVTPPQSELNVAADLQIIKQQWRKKASWDNRPDLETILLRCASLIFLQPEKTANLSTALKEILGIVYYHYLIVFLGYIKLCHQWVASNSSIQHQQDRRSQLHLGSLLLEKVELAEFLQGRAKSTLSAQAVGEPTIHFEPNPLTAIANLADATASLPQLKQRTLTTCLANAPFPVMVHNQQGKIIHLNRNWLEASGYNPQEISTLDEWNQKARVKQRKIVKLPAKNSSQLYRKYVASAHKTAIEATTALQQIVNSLIEIAPGISETEDRVAQRLADAVRTEVTIATKNGEQLYWELYSTALSFESESEELVISIAKDMTDLVDYEAKLAEAEAKLRLVLEATKTGNWSWDLTTNQVEVCHRGRTILGLENFDGSYEGFLQSIYPNERESVDLEIAKAIQAQQDLDIRYSIVRLRETAQIHTLGKLRYSPSGKPVRLTGVIIDLTSVQQSFNRHSLSSSAKGSDFDAELLGSDSLGLDRNKCLSMLQSIIDLLPYYLFVIDLNTKTISSINSGLASSFSLTKEQIIGKELNECFPPEYVKQIDWLHQQVVTSENAVHIQEKISLPDGCHYFDTVVTPLIDETGKIHALLHTSSDIPDLMATQEALSQRTIQLEAANRELESFSYSVSHDLQAPLRIINGFSQVLWENYQPSLDDRGKHYLQRIQANSKRMSDLIDALLQLSRVTRSQMKPIQVNLSAIAGDIIEELRGDNPQRQVEVKITPNLETKGDPQLLRIVLNNLLHNAWKYTSKRSQAEIEFGIVDENAEQSSYLVRDNGAGFDPEYADKLFTAFQRLHNQSEFPGTGIGLATVQRIIYRHGGKVWAEGESDRGATIYFSLGSNL